MLAWENYGANHFAAKIIILAIIIASFYFDSMYLFFACHVVECCLKQLQQADYGK